MRWALRSASAWTARPTARWGSAIAGGSTTTGGVTRRCVPTSSWSPAMACSASSTSTRCAAPGTSSGSSTEADRPVRGTIASVTSHPVDRLWPDPATDLELDDALADLALPPAPAGRPLVGLNMVTSLDGRAQLGGRAEGLSGRIDRRLLQLYRAAYDAVASGAGTLRADDFYSRLPADLAARRAAAGRPPQPTAVVIGGTGEIPTDRRRFGYAEQP